MIVVVCVGIVPACFLVPRFLDGGHNFVAQQRPQLRFEMLYLVGAVILLDKELTEAVAAAVACPVPHLKGHMATVWLVLDMLAVENGFVCDQRIIVPDA